MHDAQGTDRRAHSEDNIESAADSHRERPPRGTLCETVVDENKGCKDCRDDSWEHSVHKQCGTPAREHAGSEQKPSQTGRGFQLHSTRWQRTVGALAAVLLDI